MMAESRQAKRQGAGPAPNIQRMQRPCGLWQKLLQVGKGEIQAQPSFGSLEVGGILRSAGLEPFDVVIGGHFFRAPLRRTRPARAAMKYRVHIEKDSQLQRRRPVEVRFRRRANRLKPAANVDLRMGFSAVVTSSSRVRRICIPLEDSKLRIATLNDKPVIGVVRD